MEPVHFIQSMVAPAVMISACGLLLLGTNNKYSLVVNRIRLLNQEYRQTNNNERKKCIESQIPLLQKRMRLIKNAVWYYTVSVIFYVLVILMIGISSILQTDLFFMIIGFFVCGVFFLLLGALFSSGETRLGYKIVNELEISYHY